MLCGPFPTLIHNLYALSRSSEVKNMTTQAFLPCSQKYCHWAPLLIRLVIGYGFMVHGWAKLHTGPAGFEKLLIQIGAPFPQLTAWVVPSLEILGGLAIFLGAFVRFSSIPLIGVMLVA